LSRDVGGTSGLRPSSQLPFEVLALALGLVLTPLLLLQVLVLALLVAELEVAIELLVVKSIGTARVAVERTLGENLCTRSHDDQKDYEP
jgi:hypothetical protein